MKFGAIILSAGGGSRFGGKKPKFIETTQNLVKVTYKRDISIIKELDRMMKEGLL